MNQLNRTALSILEHLSLNQSRTVRDLIDELFPNGPPRKYGKAVLPCTLDYRIRAGIKTLLSLHWDLEGESSTLWRLNCYHFKLVKAMFTDGPVRDAVGKMDRCPRPGEVMAAISCHPTG